MARSTRTPSSTRWMQEHLQDPFVRLAREEGYRSRAAFKLLELQELVRGWRGGCGLLGTGMRLVDLGAAPGGWTQVACRAGCRVVAVDLLPMDPVAGAVVLQGDFLETAMLQAVLDELASFEADSPGRQLADVVLSDMAPNMTGIRAADQAREESLAEVAFSFAHQVLRPGGSLVIKLFQGPGGQELTRQARECFAAVKVAKPPASRGRSPEYYLIGTGFRGDRRAAPSLAAEDE
ncbi:MAG: RlmE family RNA methyltransferase [Magnetococcales bacterium]|nr:RlmE family RNA methyltransferase [Magnetococcales bacterium]